MRPGSPLLRTPSEGNSLSERAYLFIRERILRGEFPLGSALSRRNLARELGMSLLPISDALQRLESEGLVRTIPRVGTQVFHPSESDIRERYIIREALESQAARLFSEKASERERSDLLRMAERIDALFNRSASGENEPEFLYATHAFHLDFHMRIAECTGCRLLIQLIENNQVLIFNWVYDVAAKRPPLPQRFHRDLAEALVGSDPAAAAAAMRRHVHHGLDSILRALEPRVETLEKEEPRAADLSP